MASQTFLRLLAREAATHIGKSAGYAGRDNPDTWANFRNSTGWGVRPFIGCMVRLTDKFIRAQNLTRDASNEQVGESLIDTLLDQSSYAKIGVCLLVEEASGPEEPFWPKTSYAITSDAYLQHLSALQDARQAFGEGSGGVEVVALLAAIDDVLDATLITA